MDNLYEYIEKLAKDKGYKNITEFCRLAEIPRATMSELKSGRTKQLSTETLAKISTRLNVSVDSLLNGLYKNSFTAYSNGICAYIASTMEEIESQLAEKESETVHVVFRGPGVVITVDNDCNPSEEQINSVIAIYAPTHTQKENAPTPKDERKDVLDEVDVAFYGEYKELDEEQKATIRDMVAVMRSRKEKRPE